MFTEHEAIAIAAEDVVYKKPVLPDIHTDASHDDCDLQPLQNAPIPMTPVTQDNMFKQSNQFKEYRNTQKQLTSELKDIMG